MTDHRLASVTLDEASLAPATAEIEHDRRRAIADLTADNLFRPDGAAGGPYALTLSLQDSRLALDVSGPDYQRGHLISLTPLKRVLKDYELVCDNYYDALAGASPSRIEAVDMGRRGLHNDGADQLRARLDGKIEVDHPTARRLFTLVYALWRR